MSLDQRLVVLQVTLSHLIESTESEYRDLSRCPIGDKAEGQLKEKILNSVATVLDRLTDAYLFCCDAVDAQTDGTDLSDIVDSLNAEASA